MSLIVPGHLFVVILSVQDEAATETALAVQAVTPSDAQARIANLCTLLAGAGAAQFALALSPRCGIRLVQCEWLQMPSS